MKEVQVTTREQALDDAANVALAVMLNRIEASATRGEPSDMIDAADMIRAALALPVETPARLPDDHECLICEMEGPEGHDGPEGTLAKYHRIHDIVSEVIEDPTSLAKDCFGDDYGVLVELLAEVANR